MKIYVLHIFVICLCLDLYFECLDLYFGCLDLDRNGTRNQGPGTRDRERDQGPGPGPGTRAGTQPRIIPLMLDKQIDISLPFHGMIDFHQFSVCSMILCFVLHCFVMIWDGFELTLHGSKWIYLDLC